MAGSLWAHFITSFSPKSFFFTQAFSIITMLVIGGLGSVSGSVIGVVLITVLSELLRNAERGFDLGLLRLPPLYGASQILMAVLFVLVIVFRPAGPAGRPGDRRSRGFSGASRAPRKGRSRMRRTGAAGGITILIRSRRESMKTRLASFSWPPRRCSLAGCGGQGRRATRSRSACSTT